MANILKEINGNTRTVCECSELTERDIPGAILQNVPEKCKVTELRVWLKCRGQKVKSKETKLELCLRVNKCLDLGEEYTFTDPYPGQPHLEKKSLNCPACKKVLPEAVKESGTTLVWSTNATILPKTFNYLNIVDYSKGSGKQVREHVEKPINRGYSFFFDGYVHDVRAAVNEQGVCVKGKCFRSMKKHESPHNVQLSVQDSGLVFAGKCTCVAGAGGFCNHVFALLYQIDHSIKVGVKEFGRTKTCTEKPAEWLKSRTDGIHAEPVMQTTVVKPRYGSVSSGIKSSLYDARTGNSKALTDIGVSVRILSEINPLIGLCQTSNMNNTEKTQTSMGFLAPVGSVLSYHLAVTEGNFSVEENMDCKPDTMILGNGDVPDFPWQNHTGPGNVSESIIKELGLAVTAEESNHIERETMDQASSDLWFEVRRKRLTASRFGQIVRRKKDKEAFIERNLLTNKDLNNLPSIKYGRDNENVAVRQYSKYMENTGRKSTVTKCGVVVNPNFPWLAASPDRIVFQKEIGFGLLEVKCSYSKRHITPKEACQDSGFFCELLDGKLTLKREHNYYAQIQGQMGICGASFCDLVAYTEKGLGLQRVMFDESFWVEMVEKLRRFFVENFVPVLKKIRRL